MYVCVYVYTYVDLYAYMLTFLHCAEAMLIFSVPFQR